MRNKRTCNILLIALEYIGAHSADHSSVPFAGKQGTAIRKREILEVEKLKAVQVVWLLELERPPQMDSSVDLSSKLGQLLNIPP